MNSSETNAKIFFSEIKFDDNGLIPAVVISSENKSVLMLGYMNRESIIKSLACGEVVFFSRSRNTIWHKGETSGDFFKLVQFKLDCDGDALLLEVITTKGIACHTGRKSCFFKVFENNRWTEES
ncbi:MAG: phosphoribosyl-AMP cyclohydrolase [Methylacidiphilales bacterium]|nr:phosphoribosyl-AMP cyclohydrolase [Candidatus Methylacidiphilales bacterium]